jgi:hypothetical protein
MSKSDEVTATLDGAMRSAAEAYFIEKETDEETPVCPHDAFEAGWRCALAAAGIAQ